MRVLSTRILSDAQKGLLESTGIQLMEYEAISISYKSFDITEEFDYFLITSQNAVRSLIVYLKSASDPQKILAKSAFCVGSKTASFLSRAGLEVSHFEDNAKSLGEYLVEHHSGNSFLFLCGDKRRDELPALLNDHKVAYNEQVVYETSLNAVALESSYDAYLFFSPSGVKSFSMKNKPLHGTCYCIGHTTAEAASQLGLPLLIAETPTIESVLDLLVQNL